MTEEDYWSSDPDFGEIIEAAAAKGEMLLTQIKREAANFQSYEDAFSWIARQLKRRPLSLAGA